MARAGECAGTDIVNLAQYERALRGDTWQCPDGEIRRWYPVRIKHRYWTAATCSWARIHVARPVGVIRGIPGKGFDGQILPIFLCPASFAHPIPVGPADGGHELCAMCLWIAERAPERAA